MTGLRLGVVVNPTAGHGRGRRHGARLHELARARGHELVDLAVPGDLAADRSAAARHLRESVASVSGGLDALVVLGGDGMVHLGVNAVAGTGLPLGIVPGGSGNDVAGVHGLPVHDVDAALRRVERAMDRGARAVDAVAVGPASGSLDEWYVGVLSCGIDAAVSARASALSWPRGSGRYVRALLGVLGGFRPYGYRVTVDGRTWESAGSLVAVANAPVFGGGMRIAPDARMDDGLLDVVLAGPLGRAELLSVFPRVYRGTHVRHPACTVLRGRTVVVEPGPSGPPPPTAFADGERLGALPLRAEVRLGALLLLT